MEEMMMKTHESHTNPTTMTTPLPSWKLYGNPFYDSEHPQQQPQLQRQQQQQQQHCTQSPLSPSLRDFTFFPPMYSDEQSLSLSTRRVSSELDRARAQIEELKAGIEYERRMRRNAELLNKRMAREASEERKGREAAERVCEELAEEVASNRAEIERMKREMDEERKMLRIAEVWREERVQMKLADARVLLEEMRVKEKGEEDSLGNSDLTVGSLGNSSCSNGEKVRSSNQRRGSPEAENPHIRRGIRGFVEFPRVVRAVGSRERQLGSKLECQKAQLRILMRQRNPVGLGGDGPDSINLLVG
ncbi:protein BRANCHLESS TRICHOME-like [Magnolia sinica]|uniref:protein BRANCHLESS TRICHOME-like n=1 Tax=Magnolia sinica TaxID=86752 RepID=UPI002658B76D|nr:protein BRANCHLESS TRICHOME-like [Magnolia sinica]